MTFENLFLLNGVSINENIRGQAFNLCIEDAIQETTRRERRRVRGVRPLQRRRRQHHHEVWRQHSSRVASATRSTTTSGATLTPFEDERARDDPGSKPRVDERSCRPYEYTLGGPIMRDRLWFFTSGRVRRRGQRPDAGRHERPVQLHRARQRRVRRQGHLLARPSSHRFQVNYNRPRSAQINNTFNQNLTMDLRSLARRTAAGTALCRELQRHRCRRKLFVEALRLEAHVQQFIGSGAKSTDLIDGTLLIDNSARRRALVVRHVLRRLHAGRSRQRRRLREGILLPARRRTRFAQPRVRLRHTSTTSARRTTTSRAATTAS